MVCLCGFLQDRGVLRCCFNAKLLLCFHACLWKCIPKTMAEEHGEENEKKKRSEKKTENIIESKTGKKQLKRTAYFRHLWIVFCLWLPHRSSTILRRLFSRSIQFWRRRKVEVAWKWICLLWMLLGHLHRIRVRDFFPLLVWDNPWDFPLFFFRFLSSLSVPTFTRVQKSTPASSVVLLFSSFTRRWTPLKRNKKRSCFNIRHKER